MALCGVAWTKVEENASEEVGVDLFTELEREGETRGRRMTVSHLRRPTDKGRGGMSDSEVPMSK